MPAGVLNECAAVVENVGLVVGRIESAADHIVGRDAAVNLALAPEEIATLSTLMNRYDQLLVEMDNLNQRLEELLKLESPTRKIES